MMLPTVSSRPWTASSVTAAIQGGYLSAVLRPGVTPHPCAPRRRAGRVGQGRTELHGWRKTLTSATRGKHVVKAIKRLKLGSAAVAVAMLTLVGGAHAADPVRIGYSMSRTGLFAQAAPSQVTAYRLWKEPVNAAGRLCGVGQKRPYAISTYDDRLTLEKPICILDKLIHST